MAGRCLLCDDAPEVPDRALLAHMRAEHGSVTLARRSARDRAVAVAMIAGLVVVGLAVVLPILGILLGLFVRGFTLIT